MRKAWNKLRVNPIFRARTMTLKIKAILVTALVQSVSLWGLALWATEVKNPKLASL